MRHFRRLYFDNPAVAGAFETFVSVIDKGRDAAGQPFYNIRVGNLTLPSDVAQADNYLLLTSCFFKLPIGATAVVDIYAPDLVGSPEPLSFDYQVFKAKPTLSAVTAQRSILANTENQKGLETPGMHALVDAYASAMAVAAASTGPTGPASNLADATSPTGSTSAGICTYPGNCNGQTSAYCEPGQEPLFYTAVCEDEQLTCQLFEPDEETKRKR